ncbi:MAG: rod shape-determining protein MreB [Solirubrobacteraceae bacterium]|nr:rod shape-determining protein MreB [Solirubrobacteraceae bacterium]
MELFRSLRRTPDLAVDLGTANTLVYARGQGIVVSEPSVVAIDQATGEVHAVGLEAKQMIGRTPAAISAIRPLRHGVIADFEVTEQMLRHFLGRVVHGSRFARPRLVLCAPSGITDVERRALVEASSAAGASAVALIEEPMAAAIGSDLPVGEPSATMIVDIGGGTSEVAVISLGGVVCLESVRVGGYDLDEAIALHLRNNHGLATGTETAETLKIELGSAWPVGEERSVEVRGRDVASGLPTSISISSSDLRAALVQPLEQIVAAIKTTLEATPPELAGDIAVHGINLAGGGCLLAGLPELVTDRTGVDAILVADPLTCVAEGAGRSLEDFETVLKATHSWTSAPRRAASSGA